MQPGKTLKQLKEEMVLASWKDWTAAIVTSDTCLETLYNDITDESESLAKSH
jgi:hypothetical protein